MDNQKGEFKMKPSSLSDNPFFDAAVHYVQRGWQVLPLKIREKCPLGTLVPHGLLQASTDLTIINEWWRKEPLANVGIRTGKVSGIVVLDIDPRHGGTESLINIEKQYGPLPHTIRSQTGGGGQHIFFLYPGSHISNKTQLGGWPGIDVRGDNGYIVAPPSIHNSGNSYQWVVNSMPNPNTPGLAPLPPWLLKLLSLSTKSRKPLQGWRKTFIEGAQEGTRNETLASIIGHLLAHKIDPFITAGLMLAWNQTKNSPPLTEKEVLSTVDSIAKKELQRRQGAKGVKP